VKKACTASFVDQVVDLQLLFLIFTNWVGFPSQAQQVSPKDNAPIQHA
jgi:hypothetical protein